MLSLIVARLTTALLARHTETLETQNTNVGCACIVRRDEGILNNNLLFQLSQNCPANEAGAGRVHKLVQANRRIIFSVRKRIEQARAGICFHGEWRRDQDSVSAAAEDFEISQQRVSKRMSGKAKSGIQWSSFANNSCFLFLFLAPGRPVTSCSTCSTWSAQLTQWSVFKLTCYFCGNDSRSSTLGVFLSAIFGYFE